jgi:hypothetical protein
MVRSGRLSQYGKKQGGRLCNIGGLQSKWYQGKWPLFVIWCFLSLLVDFPWLVAAHKVEYSVICLGERLHASGESEDIMTQSLIASASFASVGQGPFFLSDM